MAAGKRRFVHVLTGAAGTLAGSAGIGCPGPNCSACFGCLGVGVVLLLAISGGKLRQAFRNRPSAGLSKEVS